MQNFDLDVRTDAASGALLVAVSSSPAGEAPLERMTVPTNPAGWRDALPAAVWAHWRESVGRAGDAGLRLRVRTADTATAALPWELLYDPARQMHLALDPATPVVRYLPGPIPVQPELPVDHLRLLLVGASPNNLPPLAVPAELAAVATALAQSPNAKRLSVKQLPQAQAHTLEAQLLDVKPHVLHIAGHATTSAQGEGILILEDQRGKADQLPAAILANLLRSRRVRLVVLNACDTAASRAGQWAGLAQALVLAGVPAVIAMREPLADSLALAFAESFYQALAAGEPVDVALTLARITLAQAGLAINQLYAWALPVLFLRSEAVQLWTPVAAGPAQTDDTGHVRIGTVYATNYSERDQYIDMRNSTITLGGGPDPAQARKLDEILANQAVLQSQVAEMRLALLARFDVSEQRILSGILAKLDERQVQEVTAVTAAAQAGQVTTPEMREVLAALGVVLGEVRMQRAQLGDLAAQVEEMDLGNVVEMPEAGVSHRFVLTVPVVPFLLNYEGEVALDGKVNLQAAWQRLLARVRR